MQGFLEPYKGTISFPSMWGSFPMLWPTARSGGWPAAIVAANLAPLMADFYPGCMVRMQGYLQVPLDLVKVVGCMAGSRR